jgi:class 3 adenylate cyclase
MAPDSSDAREEAFAAAARNEWPRVRELLAAADGSLDGEGHELLATAYLLTGAPPEALGAFEAAYRAHLEAGDEERAAGAAARVAGLLLEGGALNRALAWLDRGDELVRGTPESLVHGWLAITRSLSGLFRGDPEITRTYGRAAQEIGRRFGHAGLEALGLNGVARAEIMEGRADEGLRMMDEVAVAAASGKLDSFSAGIIFCSTVCASQTVGDYRRSAQWTDEMERWTAASGLPYFPGRCRVHRAELLRLHGAWAEAEREARIACDDLRKCGPVDIGWALSELGLIRLRLGKLDGAEAAFDESRDRGRVPHPGLALLYLARGDVQRAARSIRDALDDPPEWPAWEAPLNTRLGRAFLLPVQVEVAITAGDLDRAAEAADELNGIAEQYPTVAMQASAAEARGRVQLAQGEPAAARRTLQAALRQWAEVDAPYEIARIRVAMAEALRATGDEEAALDELKGARAALERLGARLEARRAAELAGIAGATTSVTRTFVFTDIVGSTDLARVMGDDDWHQLKRWHDERITSLVADHGGEVVDSTGDGFFLAFPDAATALRAAIDIQRALADHRRTAGFAPRVRIGVHAADAMYEAAQYSGLGVHAAARIAASAGADQVRVSAATLAAAGEAFDHDDPEPVELKGLAAPLPVATIHWR